LSSNRKFDSPGHDRIALLQIGSYSYEPNAFKFGDDIYSYAQLKLPERHFWQRNFHLTFDFRSFYPNGMLYLSPGSKEKPKHYVALILKDGQLVLVVRGRRREELQLTAKLNDGEWHRVTISCQDRKVTMSVEIGRTDQKIPVPQSSGYHRKTGFRHQIDA